MTALLVSLDDSFALYLSLIIYAIFVLGMIGLALSNLPRNTQQDESVTIKGQHQPDSYKGTSISNYEWRIVILTSVIALVTAGYTLVATFQWNAMRTSNALTQEEFRASNRPWIGLVAGSPIQIDRQYIRPDGTTEFVGKFNIQNFGTSVAVNTVTIGFGMGTDPEAACHRWGGMKFACDAAAKFATGEVPQIPPSHEKLGIVLFPNQTATARLDLAADLGVKRPVNVAITGCAVYIDQRKEMHQTIFCEEAMFSGQGFEPWASCNVCNEAK